MKRLSRRFYSRPTEELAPALLGKLLVCGDRVGRIVETEAYLGPADQASHTRFGKTARNEVMFGTVGVAYVYFIYGMYDMFNVVGYRGREAGAVLVRALEPIAGIGDDVKVASGPGKLTRAMGIRRSAHYGADLVTGGDLYIAGGARRAGAVATGPRIGVDYAGAWARRRLRFWIEGNRSVSRAR